MIKKIVVLFILFAAMALSTACASLTTQPGDTPDRVIQENVVNALADYTSTVSVSTVNGRVYLSGWLPNKEMKERALETAEKVDGVKQVLDDILIKESGIRK